ncbi:hypothetical protein BST61_g5220 [Cercospora zeina]
MSLPPTLPRRDAERQVRDWGFQHVFTWTDGARLDVDANRRHEVLSFSLHIRLPSATMPPANNGRDVPPLAVYHICRVCLRPRSARYHREHPIPIDGMPPPPGICRRCQVPTKTRRSVVEVVEEGRSNDIKIGIASFVPDAEYTTNAEARQRRARRLLSSDDWQEIEVPRPEKPSKHAPERIRERDMSPVDLPRDTIVYKQISGPTSSPVRRSPMPFDYMPALPPPPPPPSSTSKKSVSDAAQNTFESISIPPPPLPAHEFESGAIHTYVPVKTSRRKDSSRAPCVERVETNSDSKYAHVSEYEIRKLAREEVIRYRQAERKIETHADPYAHGRMVQVVRVPVERRIVQEKDTAVNEFWMPSKKVHSNDSASATVGREPPSEVISVQVSQRHNNRATTSNSMRDKEAEVRSKVSTVASSPSAVSSDKTRWSAREARESAAIKLQADQRQDTWRHTHGKEDIPSGTQYPYRARDKVLEEAFGAVGAGPTHTARANVSDQGSRSGANDDWGEREYEYRRRTVTPVRGRIPQSDEVADHYRETTELLHHRVHPGTSVNAAGGKHHLDEIRRRISDASSHVHFAKKLDISPTPPDSDASSSEFRDMALAGGINELRGARVHLPQRFRTQDRPQSGVPDTAGLSERVLSESPSREQSRRASSPRNIDGYGPYVRHQKRSASVDVEDGSTVASVSRSGREHGRHEGRRGVR